MPLRARTYALFSAIVFAALGGLIGAAASAQAGYPDRPIRLIVPFPAGGGGDTLARTVMNKAAEYLGQPIVIENRPGAGGNIGTEAAARAAPDGYTLAYGTNGTHAINQTLYRRTGFDPIKDFAPISRLTRIALILVVHPSLPAHSVQDLIAYLKANPGKVSVASAGNGTSSHLAAELFRAATDVDVLHVPYRGGGPAMTDLIGGQVQMMIEVMPNAFPQVEAGKLRALAVTTAERWSQAPNIPTMIESGVPDFDVTAWDAVFAPRDTPAEVIGRVNAAIRKALDDPQTKRSLLARGAEPAPSSPDELGRFVATELVRWGKAVQQAGAKID
jgi:tripartite-type tricarboxylate transporter receptor subunit TctC